MSDLAAFQRDFAARLLDPSQAEGPGFAVYRNSSARAARDALAANFPTVLTLIGAGAFDMLASSHFRSRPPASPILAGYGEGFPEFLAGAKHVRRLAYLPDVARIDRCWTEAHLAADAPRLDPAALGRLLPDQLMALQLSLHPATRFGWFETPAPTIWLAHRDRAAPDFSDLRWREEGLLLARSRGVVEGRIIDRATHDLLAGIQDGRSLGAAAIETASSFPDADMAGTFADLIASGAFARPDPDLRTWP